MLVKQTVPINFSKGLDLKTDPWQVTIGNFLSLQNSIFTKGGLLQKRNGYGQLSVLPDSSATYATTLNGNLTAIGTSLQAYSESTKSWLNKGEIEPVDLSVLPLIRSNTNQSQVDTAFSSNGFVCTTYTDNTVITGSSTPVYKYVIADAVTGQNIIEPTDIPVLSGGAINGSSRAFLVGNYFVIVSPCLVSATTFLQYFSISTSNPTVVSQAQNVHAEAYVPISSNPGWDGIVASDTLVVAYNTTAGGQGVHVTTLTASQVASNSASSIVHAFTNSAYIAAILSITYDATSNPNIFYISFWNNSTTDAYCCAVTIGFGTITTQFNPVKVVNTTAIANLAMASQNGGCNIYYEIVNAYGYDSGIPSNFINVKNISSSGAFGAPNTRIRSVGLASKAFIVDGTVYFLAAYQSPYQPTYFLVNATFSTEINPTVIAKFAYGNGGGYVTTGLPSVTVTGSVAQVGYLFKDLIQAVNKNTNVPTGTQTAGIYSQTGINLASLEIGSKIISAEIGSNLNLIGGFVWGYDGYALTEQNFFVWPDSIEASWSTTGGSIAAQPDGSTNTNAYYYQVTYEWTDNQGNAFRSAPSIPIAVTTSGSGTSGSITLHVPTLRLTYKTANPVKIVIYRWSVAQQIYYQTTSISVPLLNDLTVDSVDFVDTNDDATILGNNIIYTTGGVVEDISPPACKDLSLFDDRLVLIDSEDGNIWFSKQVIPATPVEMSDLFTIYVAPSIGSNGSTGTPDFTFPMDDKLIVFKENTASSAIYYINGTGPDNTGANNQYSQPIFITSTVGSNNKNSVVLIPQGLMFQSNKGIWLLGRDLSTSYIGAPVEDFNQYTIDSAVSVPGTNQVRFTLSNGVTLMYDYFYGQWGTFVGVPAISSTLYQGLHTFINSFGQVYQETPNQYLDGANPVLLSLTTSWIATAGIQGYQAAFFFFILGKYITPFKLQVSVAYDFNPSPEQSNLIQPNNFSPAYAAASPNGQQTVYGQNTPYAGPGNVLRERVFLTRHRCESFQVSIQEVYDPSFGIVAGAGLTLSGLNMQVAVKKGFRPTPASNSVGGS